MNFLFHVPYLKEYEKLLEKYLHVYAVEYENAIYSRKFPLHIVGRKNNKLLMELLNEEKKMKVIIAHGALGKPNENWIPWLEDELDLLGIEYLSPAFPTPKHQNYQDWARILDIYRLYECFNNNTIFIGHSCGAAFLAKYIAKNNIKCKCFISVSGYNNFFNNDEVMDNLNSTFYLTDSELKKVIGLADKRIAIHSDNDPFIPQDKLKEFVELMIADEYVVHNGGHLNKAAGIIQFELLLNLIKNQL